MKGWYESGNELKSIGDVNMEDDCREKCAAVSFLLLIHIIQSKLAFGLIISVAFYQLISVLILSGTLFRSLHATPSSTKCQRRSVC